MKKNVLRAIVINTSLLIFGVMAALLIAEVVVRLTWDKKEGVPGLVLGHPTRVEVFAPGYEGYYAGVPLKINNLGFRDDRDYDMKKSKDTYRIIVIGDSVTFGQGCIYEGTYPYILEQLLEEMRPGIDWQVWNLGVPGYSPSLELATLEELGPLYDPDLVVVGFFRNDCYAPDFSVNVNRPPDYLFHIKGFLKRHFYLYTKLRYAYNVMAELRSGDVTQCEHEQRLLKKPDREDFKVDLSGFAMKHKLPGAPVPPEPDVSFLSGGAVHPAPEWIKVSLDKFKEYHSSGVYNIVFFVNSAPDVNTKDDIFVDGPANVMNDYFIELLSGPAPVVSSYDAFWAYRPSDAPYARGHSRAPGNLVKAQVLLDFLVDNSIIPAEM